MHFIGRVEHDRLEAVALGLIVPFAPFRLALGRHALWTNGIAALEPAAVPDRLTALHRSLGSRLGALELPVEARGFRPHVTLARDARRSEAPASDAAIAWRVNGYALVASRSDRRYDVIAAYPPR